MIIGIGLDIIEIARFDKPENEAFNKRCFTQREMEYLRGKGTQSRAGLFAAKEAVAKALGTGFCGFWPCEVEILHDGRGRPYAVLHDKAARVAKRVGIDRITLSITHHQSTAAAMAAAERTGRYARRIRRTNAQH